ncbi:E2 [Tick-associated papillomavirus lsx]|nr:E2 [Tick-associated papillomavirus lsx]
MKMEKLATGLDVCQEKLLELIELNSNLLQDQIQYWKCCKREQLILHAARKLGCSRLGYEPVPACKVSEHKAKEAIKMLLLLETLQQSPFCFEPWTLPQTSIEMLHTPPANCFKKEGEQLEVQYEGNAEKAMTYVKWQSIYSQDENGDWHKSAGYADYNGLWYNDATLGKTCYVSFAEEAKKYGNDSPWVVYTNSGTLLFSSIATNSDSPDWAASLPWTSKSPSSQHSSSWGRHLSPIGQPCQSGSRPITPRCGSPQTPAVRGGGHRQRPRERPRQRPFGGRSEKAAGQAEGRPRPSNGNLEKRSGQNSKSASPNPVLIFKGPPNKLKCWRSRCWKGYRDTFLDFSSGFTWLVSGTRGKDACVLISFRDSEQMKLFRTTVPRPKDLTDTYGHFYQ